MKRTERILNLRKKIMLVGSEYEVSCSLDWKLLRTI